MPILTKGKTNWKYILIVMILTGIVGGLTLYWYSKFPEIVYPPIKPPKMGGEFLYVLTQNFGTLATEPIGEFEWPFFEVLKVDLKTSKIIKKIKSDGLGVKIKKGKNVYILSYKFPPKIRELTRTEDIVRAIQSLKSFEDLEKFITVYDENLNQIASYSLDIFDFQVDNNYLYGLGEKKLEIFDFQNPTNPQKISSLSFGKTSHDIIFKDDKLYILDNIMMPLYLHLVDVKNPKEPKLFTYQTWGINAHLDTQDVTDKWFIVESYAHMGGGGRNLLVFTITPPIQPIANIDLQSGSWLEIKNWLEIRRIKIIDSYLYALNLTNYNSVELLIYDLKDLKEAKNVSAFLLEENKNLHLFEEMGIRLPLVSNNNILYYGGDDGVYIIDISDPSKPSKQNIIKTDFQVISLELSAEDQ